MIKKSFCEASHSHSHLILDPGSAYYDDAGGGFAPSSVNGVCRSKIQVAVAVAVASLTKRFFNDIQKDFLINVWGEILNDCLTMATDNIKLKDSPCLLADNKHPRPFIKGEANKR